MKIRPPGTPTSDSETYRSRDSHRSGGSRDRSRDGGGSRDRGGESGGYHRSRDYDRTPHHPSRRKGIVCVMLGSK